MSVRVVIESPYTPRWNGETGHIVDIRPGTYSNGAPCQIALIKLDRIAASVEFAMDELVEL